MRPAPVMPGRRCVGRGLPAEFLPAFGHLAGGEAQFPFVAASGRRNTVPALWRHLFRGPGRGDRPVVGVAGGGQNRRQFRVGQHLGGMPPGLDYVSDRGSVTSVSRWPSSSDA